MTIIICVKKERFWQKNLRRLRNLNFSTINNNKHRFSTYDCSCLSPVYLRETVLKKGVKSENKIEWVVCPRNSSWSVA